MLRSAFKSSVAKYNPNIFCRLRYVSTATSKDELEGSVASYYGKNANYSGLFGTNIHFGYFPHIADPSKPIVHFPESGFALNQHMIDIAGINSTSNVIDFGCGVGGPIFDVSQVTNCRATGLDLTPEFVDSAKQQFATKNNQVNYVVGSIIDLPPEIKNGPTYTHVFSIQAICHVARFINDILREAYSVLDTNGIVVINDFVVSENGPSDKAKAHFYKRLHFDHLLTFADYAEALTHNRFEIVKFENCSKHAKYGYEILAPQAKEAASIEADGLPLSVHYEETSRCFERGELGMIAVVARKI